MNLKNIVWNDVFVSWHCQHKVPQTAWLKQQTCILSLFWRPDVQDQDVGKAVLPLEPLGKDPFQVSLLASGSSLAVELQYSHGVLPVCMSLCQEFPFYKDTSHIALEPTLMT